MEPGGGHSLPVLLLLLLLLLLRPSEVNGREAPCPRPCGGRCPAEPPRCAPGVPAVLDGCGCCLVCARQRGESCSPLLPCDESGGLYCDRGPEDGGGTGICMVLEGDNCVFDGMIYRNGETFQPSCKYQCTCRDGQIGCLPRCNLGLLLPGPDCPFPRKIEVPGECCEKWVCEPRDEVLLGGFAMAAYRQEATLGIDVSDSSANCIEQTTEWSACSRSCGMGFSTRVTNRNQQCEMVKQTRLCMMRPCENEEPSDKKGKKCIRTKKSMKAVRFEYKNCTSVQTYKPRYCGLCNDGRCCTPHNTKTIQVEFRCPQGKFLKKPMMLINTCVCHGNCPQSNNAFFQPLDPMSSEAKI
ncbi:CCN family member 3 precursor [Coturnix japonica]|uniref:CCN family member 3 n=2 Tax=Phasianidae TaxID=9005 RepID=CCN3_COTJA|nr:CCN family member 3 precursor [Coturnix japonica]P42642.1 RecName: Full=CCN family member 3; AltName: Full=Cellular communication network factor 3; AltName: Full=Nephroblastoma-overexpressed gene protein; AltName: Full=Protein NOV; Flags: Precursor [Coturnix japonica]AAA21128.1 cellular proto-oncogene protein Nov [Coturnix japonica]